MTGRTRFSLIMAILLSFSALAGIFTRLPEAKLTIRAVDEEGLPLQDMPVHVWLSESAIRDGDTAEDGTFVAQGPCSIKDVPISIFRNGYYGSRVAYSYPNYRSVTNDKWQPWNPTVTVVVRRVVNPIPMYMKRVEVLVPIENEPFSFDLEAGDLVKPYGSGRMSDLTFLVTRRVTSPDDYEGTLTLSFSSTIDGIQEAQGMILESEFDFPRFAPRKGYQSKYTYSHGKDPKRGYYGNRIDDPKKYYLFRVRCVQNGDGMLEESLYGTIRGQIELSGIASSNSVRVLFLYSLNPRPNDRNLEFDPNINLFGNQ